MNALPIDNHQPEQASAGERPPSGDVAGTVLRAARLSAGLSRTRLAVSAGLDEKTVLAWEDGTRPLACVPVPQLQVVRDALRSASRCLNAPLIRRLACRLLSCS